MASYPGVEPPPPGIVPNLEHPQPANYSLLLGWLIACGTISTLFFSVRAYGKLFILKRILREDVTCAIAWVLYIIYTAFTAASIYYGQGHHSWEVSPADNSQIRKWLYAGTVVYCPASYFTKVTLLLIIARIFAVRELVSKGIYCFMGVLLIAYLPIQFIKVFICSPIRSYWDTSISGKCMNQTQLFYADISLAIITDLFILLLPIPLTWSLEAPMSMKVKVVMMLGAGGIATAVTTYRQVLAVHFMHSKDPSADFAIIIITVLLELTIGLACSCLPTFNMLSQRWNMPRLLRFNFRKAKISDPTNLTSILTVGRVSDRFRGGQKQKRTETDFDGSFERLEDGGGGQDGSTSHLFGVDAGFELQSRR